MDKMTRRGLLGTAAAAGISAILPGSPEEAQENTKGARSRRVLRIAHLTDIHVQPNGPARAGMEKAIAAINAMSDQPQLLMTGGDQIMDAFGADEARTKAQWDVWQAVMAGNKIPARHTIGNHDVWGWTGPEPRRGKVWAMEILGLAKPYYSFDQAGWHIVVLDCTQPKGTGYVARLDNPQFEWLTGDLAANKTKPTLIVSHQPLFAACAYLDGNNEQTGNWVVPGAWMNIDFRRIKDLFKVNPQVKLAISGHIHLVDEVKYLGVAYSCNGAVSGGWWGGNYQEFAPGFAIVDLFHDGTFTNTFQTYTWK